MSLLEIAEVGHRYEGASGRAVLDGVNLSMDQGDIVAVVGESGCGKTTLGKVIVGLERPADGLVSFEGRDLRSLGRREFKQYRRAVQMIHQDPFASLNPGITIGDALGAAVLYHGLATRRTVRDLLLSSLGAVGLDATPSFLNRYPHQLSGGQRQRVAIARAMNLEPRLVVADESTSMLDVSMRVAILDLLLGFAQERSLAYVFISHDFGLVRYFARGGRVVVMFYGTVVEEGPSEAVVTAPRHPYTWLLLEAVPIPDPQVARRRVGGSEERDLEGPPTGRGCPFSNRCPFVEDKCRSERPPLAEISPGHRTACWYPERVPTLPQAKEVRVASP